MFKCVWRDEHKHVSVSHHVSASLELTEAIRAVYDTAGTRCWRLRLVCEKWRMVGTPASEDNPPVFSQWGKVMSVWRRWSPGVAHHCCGCLWMSSSSATAKKKKSLFLSECTWHHLITFLHQPQTQCYCIVSTDLFMEWPCITKSLQHMIFISSLSITDKHCCGVTNFKLNCRLPLNAPSLLSPEPQLIILLLCQLHSFYPSFFSKL